MEEKIKGLNDLQLVENIKHNNIYAEPSIEELASRHGPLINTLSNKFTPVIKNTGIYPGDIFGNFQAIVYEAALSYDSSKKTKYSSWLYQSLRYKCLNSITEAHKFQSVETDGVLDYFSNQFGVNTSEDHEELYIIIDSLIDELDDERIRIIIRERYLNKDKTWKEICSKIGISTQTGITLKELGIKQLKNKLTSYLKKKDISI
jgi:DNA-directed RNA polymerase specialized sigma24 family protein